jgi:hypothetical protein
MVVPRGMRRVSLIGLGLLAAGPLVVAHISSERAPGADAGAPVMLLAGALLMAAAAGRVVSSGAASPWGLRVIAWTVPVAPTLLALFVTGFVSLSAVAGFNASSVFLLLTVLWSPVLLLWTVFGVAVVVTRPPSLRRPAA